MNSRRTDPDTSSAAAIQHEGSGKAASNRELVLSYVRTFPGKTSSELAILTGLERHEAARRLADLKHIGEVYQGDRRACSTNGNFMMTWLPAVRRDQPQAATKQQTLW